MTTPTDRLAAVCEARALAASMRKQRPMALAEYPDLPEVLEGLCDLLCAPDSAEPRGIFGKYMIAKVDGSPVDPAADYFVLRLDTDPHARVAALAYARSVKTDNVELAKDLALLVYAYDPVAPRVKWLDDGHDLWRCACLDDIDEHYGNEKRCDRCGAVRPEVEHDARIRDAAVATTLGRCIAELEHMIETLKRTGADDDSAAVRAWLAAIDEIRALAASREKE